MVNCGAKSVVNGMFSGAEVVMVIIFLSNNLDVNNFFCVR